MTIAKRPRFIHLACAALHMGVGGYVLGDTSTMPAQLPSAMPDLRATTTSLVQLAVIVALLVIVLFAATRFIQHRAQQTLSDPRRRMRVVESHRLDARRQLVLAEVDGSVVLLAYAEHGVAALSLPRSNPSFADHLAQPPRTAVATQAESQTCC